MLLKVATAEGASDVTSDEVTLGTLHRDLELAGFELMDECDASLAAKLQPTALERLSVRTRLGNLDPEIASEALASESDDVRRLLYEGRVLLWRRNYGSEQRQGRLVVEKLDYLQQTLVNGLVVEPVGSLARQVRRMGERARGAVESILPTRFRPEAEAATDKDDGDYGACAVTTSIDRACLGDAFEGVGPLGAMKVLLGTTNVSEPTYGELVVAWRRAPPPAATQLPAKARIGIPAIISAVDQNRDGQISLEEITSAVRSPRRITEAARRAVAEGVTSPPPPPLELRLFKQIPIANYEITLPNSQPEFALADWLRLDFVSLPALIALLSSYKFDVNVISLDVAATSAIVVWLIRTLLIYRNTNDRYQLLLNQFLTEKLCIRDGKEVRAFAAREAKKEQARVAASVLTRLREHGQPMSKDELLTRAAEAAGKAARVDFEPALRQLIRLGLVRTRGGAGRADAPLDVPHEAVSPEEASPAQEHTLHLEAAPDMTSLSAHWQRLLGV